MDAFDERILRDDDPVDLRGVVLDPVHEPALFELRQKPELTELRELHQSPC